MDVLNNKNLDLTNLVLSVITRIGFLLYWIFDNLAILSKIKILNLKTKALAKRGSTFWFIALVSTFILTIKNIVALNQKIDKPDTKDKIRKEVLLLIKTFGDMLPAGQGCQFYQNAFGFKVNEGYCGLGGLTSAVISSY